MKLTLSDFTHDEWKRAASMTTKPGRKPKFAWKCYRSDFKTARERGWIEVRATPSDKPHVMHVEARFTDLVERTGAKL